MEKLLISLWFGTLTMSNHLHKSLPFKTGHNDTSVEDKQFKQWLLANGASAELSNILCSNGIRNIDILRCVGSDIDALTEEFKLSTVQKVQFKSLVKKSMTSSSSMLEQLNNSFSNLKPSFRSFMSGSSNSSNSKTPRESNDNKDNLLINNEINSDIINETIAIKNKRNKSSNKKIQNLDSEEAMAIHKITDKIKQIEKSMKSLEQQSKSYILYSEYNINIICI